MNPTYDKSLICAKRHVRHWDETTVADQETYELTVAITFLKRPTIY